MKETIIYKDKFIEKPDLNKIQEYIDYCEDGHIDEAIVSKINGIIEYLNELSKNDINK